MNTPEQDCEFPPPDGFSVEVYPDGSRRFTGEGGGVIHLINDRCVLVMVPNNSHRSSRFDTLSLFRESLRGLTRNGEPWIKPSIPIDPGDPVTWRVLSHYKAELLILVESLVNGDAQFFRTLGEQLKPVPSKLKEARESKGRQDLTSEAVSRSIEVATLEGCDVPNVAAALKAYRNLRDHVAKGSALWNFGKGTAGETSSNFRKKLNRYGFSWLPRKRAGG